MDIELHIDRLILEGLPVDRCGIAPLQAAVEAELVRRLNEERIGRELLSGGARESASGGSIQLVEGDSPAHWGRQIGQSVFAGLSR